MKQIKIPETYNYIAVFLTFACNLKCDFCINRFESDPETTKRKPLTGKEWVTGLNRIISRPDLPITLSGGEPTLHKDFTFIANNTRPDLTIDVLTNLRDEQMFLKHIEPGRLKRKAPYASIRVSYHPRQMERDSLMEKVLKMQKAGFSIGIWGIMHPEQKNEIRLMQKLCKQKGIDFRTKEFLGEYRGRIYGTYRYPDSISKQTRGERFCKTTVLVVGPEGSIYRCHADLYEHREPIGHILNPDFRIEDKFRFCTWYGHCNPCDIKTKTDRFQHYGHCSVKILQKLE